MKSRDIGDREGEVGMGEIVKVYFVPNGSYLMEMAEDGVGGPSVEALRQIGHEIRTSLRPDAVVVASPHWMPKSGFFVDDGARHESFNDYPLRMQPLYVKKLRGFTRGNIPTPDVPGPSLP
jgi:aromatic ring-opening dioxygenase catalytic subunit (LigB family)